MNGNGNIHNKWNSQMQKDKYWMFPLCVSPRILVDIWSHLWIFIWYENRGQFIEGGRLAEERRETRDWKGGQEEIKMLSKHDRPERNNLHETQHYQQCQLKKRKTILALLAVQAFKCYVMFQQHNYILILAILRVTLTFSHLLKLSQGRAVFGNAI